MLISVVNGATGIIVRMKILSQATGYPSGLTGLTSASAGLIISTIADNEATATAYTQAGSTIQTITTLGTYAAPSASNCRFKEVDATNHPGVYEMQFANARYAVSASKYLLISIGGSTTNLIQSDAIISLPVFDPYSSSNAVGVAASVTGAVGSVTGNVGGITGVTFPATVASPTNITAGTITTVTNLTNAPGAGDFTATMKTSLNAATPASVTGAVGSVTGAVGSVTGNVGGNVVGSVGSVVGSVGSVVTKTGYALASTGLDAVSIADISNDADARSTFPKMIRALFNRHFNAVTCTATAQVVANDSAAATSTMALSDDGTTITKAKSA